MTITFSETEISDGNASLRPIRATPKLAKPLEGLHPHYPYENIVLQGGGAKAIVYGGSVRALDELGILPYVKRVAAASAGCAPGLMVALGLDSAQLCAETNAMQLAEFFDGGKNIPCGEKLVLGWRAFNKLGMHPADMVMEHFGKMLEKYTGNPDLTFLDLYNQCGRELCIVASNVSRAQSEYFHVNTTPDVPVRRAIRASMSLPILWEPIELFEGEKYVDGGLFTNFPLKAFDGWFLSTDRGADSIIARTMQENPELDFENAAPHEIIEAYKKTMQTSFQKPNPATIGFRAADDDTPDEAAYATYLDNLENRLGESIRSAGMDESEKQGEALPNIKFPDTELANAYLEKKSKEGQRLEISHKYEDAYVESTRWFVANANKIPISKRHPQGFETAGWVKALKSNPPEFSFSLFGFNSWEEFVDAFDFGSKGYVIQSDIGRFWDMYAVRHPYMKNRKPKQLETLGSLTGELLNSMYNVAEENLLRDPENAKRICLLSTKYVGLLDLELEVEDKEFLFQLGKRDTLAWIKARTGH